MGNPPLGAKGEDMKANQDEILLRLKRLRARMREAGVEAALVTSPYNRRYYSGFKADDTMINESSGCLLVSLRGQWLLTDSRYSEVAAREAPLFGVVECKKGLVAALAAHPAMRGRKPLHFEPAFLPFSVYNELAAKLAGRLVAPLPFDLAEARAVKTEGERKLVQKALDITEAALAKLKRLIKPGVTEAEAALFLETEFRRLGADGPSFETIVASGPNASSPHATAGARTMRPGEAVVVDCGARYAGYCADITRTYFVGGVSTRRWQEDIYGVVRQAQLAAIEAIKPGVAGAEVDKVARAIITQAGYGRNFGHGLGHGVGLAIHEAPTLSPRNQKPLEAGQIVTVEPGIYLPGRGGVRLEQLVLVTPGGCRVMNGNEDFYDF